MTKLLRVGLIGAGVFGNYHAAKIAGADGVAFSGIVDADEKRAAALSQKHSSSAIKNAGELFQKSDAVIIATPANTHTQLVEAALKTGCHVLVEKPLALRADDATKLVDIAESRNLVLQVGHQERLVCKTLGLLAIKDKPQSIIAIREGTPPEDGRNMDVSVVWDLMIHDLDLAHHLLGPGREVLASEGKSRLGHDMDRCETEVLLSNCSARLIADRTARTRKRTLALRYKTGEISIDFIRRTVTNTTPYQLNAAFADDVPDPLGAADYAFFDACRGLSECPAPGHEAAWAVATAERIEQMAMVETGVIHG